jgi:hypothetical protein
MMDCKVTHQMQVMEINHLEIHKVEVQQEEYMVKMMILLKEVSIEMVSILGVAERSSLCIRYQTLMVANKF